MSASAYPHWNPSYLPVSVDGIVSPSLLFYEARIIDNIRKAIDVAGSPERLRPHVKTYKTREVVAAQRAMGINKFKCATIAEADMLGSAGAPDVLIAYPMVGPNIARVLELARLYPATAFSVIFDDEDAVRELSAAVTAAHSGVTEKTGAGAANSSVPEIGVYVDLDGGMHRTGVSAPRALELFELALGLPGLKVEGIHCYDGQNHQAALSERQAAGSKCYADLIALRKAIQDKGMPVGRLVLGGTPPFGIYAGMPDVDLSPGTCFLQDWGYMSKYPDLDFAPAALVLTRVISVSAERGTFTLDLGCKAIASDPPGLRGVIYDRGPDFAEALFQSEEHWVFKIKDGKLPAVGEAMYVLPTHICPTVNLYDYANLIDASGTHGQNWEIVARHRTLRV